jgi:hypothetical protein
LPWGAAAFGLRPTLTSDDRRILFDFTGPLSSWGAKTIVGYAFNLFGPETRDDLDLIRLLQNEFAHSRKSFGFATPQVAAVCAELKSPEWPGSFVPLGIQELAKDNDELAASVDMANAKSRYVKACYTISERLLDHSNAVGATRTKDLR